MTAAVHSVLVRSKALGISLALGKASDGSDCIIWRGPKGSMTPDLKADMVANKVELVSHFRDERRAEITAAMAAAYDRIGTAYPGAHDAGLPEVARQLLDLFVCVENLEGEVEAAAIAYRESRGSRESFLSALAAWECGVLDAVATLANVRTGRLCADCGTEATIALVTSLGRRICSTCARADAAVARRACLPRRLSA